MAQGYDRRGGERGKNEFNKSGAPSNGGKRSYGDKPATGERSYGDRANGNGDRKPYGKKPYGERSYGDKPATGERTYGERANGNGERKPYGKKPYGERSYGDKPATGERTYGGDRANGNGDRKPYGKKPYGERTYGDKPATGERSYGDRANGNDERKPYGKKPYGERSYGKRPYDRGETSAAENAVQPDAPVQQTEQDELPFLIFGRNAVREAVKNGRSIDRILVNEEMDGSLREIVGLARDRKLVIREVNRKKLDEVCMPFGHGGKTANHQGIAAYAAGVEYCDVNDILDVAKARGEEPFVIVLDGVMDPHNLGGIIRSAACAGAHGVVIGKRRSASVTAAAVKAAAGAAEHVKIARVVNIPAALEQLKKRNLWIAGADMSGRPMTEQGLNGALALVIGGEGEGLSKLVRESCDFLVAIPMRGEIGSLNASVAAGVLMFEKMRQDALKE